MGYFSNGTEGRVWQDENCRQCARSDNPEAPGCWIWDQHLLYNGDPKHRTRLDALIPRTWDGLWNETCSQYLDPTD